MCLIDYCDVIQITMAELIRDTAFGHLLRFVSRGKLLKYAEEADPSLWEKYLDKEKSGHLADHGDTNPREEDDEEKDDQQTGDDAEKRRDDASSDDENNINEPSGVKVDPEKGRDKHVISWWGEHDTE